MTMTKFSRINKQREEITMRVLEDMEKGGNEWKKPWVEASPLPPHNPVSGTQYSGRNFLYTYVYGMMRGYADPRWATEKQIKEMGWKIPENLQNGRGGINDELGVGIEHWGMYAYCKVILRNEARDAYDQRKRKLKREQLFGEMSPEELNKLITTDRYFQFERDIVEDGLHFIVCDQGVYDALMTLPGAKRKIVLLSYFGEMNDREIGDALGTGRANVQYHRSRALAMMRKMLEQESEEY